MGDTKHLVHYLVLIFGLLSCFFFFLLLRYNPTYQFYAVCAAVVWYLFWGIVHHYLENRVSIPIILEYLLVGGLVVLLFALMLNLV